MGGTGSSPPYIAFPGALDGKRAKTHPEECTGIQVRGGKGSSPLSSLVRGQIVASTMLIEQQCVRLFLIGGLGSFPGGSGGEMRGKSVISSRPVDPIDWMTLSPLQDLAVGGFPVEAGKNRRVSGDPENRGGRR